MSVQLVYFITYELEAHISDSCSALLRSPLRIRFPCGTPCFNKHCFGWPQQPTGAFLFWRARQSTLGAVGSLYTCIIKGLQAIATSSKGQFQAQVPYKGLLASGDFVPNAAKGGSNDGWPAGICQISQDRLRRRQLGRARLRSVPAALYT